MILNRKKITDEIIFANDTVSVRWCPKVREHYESLGYKYTKNFDYFDVDPIHITKGSNIRTDFVCPNCKDIRTTNVCSVFRAGHSFCKKCVKTIKLMDDLTGNVYNKLTVVKNTGRISSSENYLWECICECGNTVITTGYALKSGHTKSCGCIRIISTETNSNNEKIKRWRHLVFKRDRGRCFLCKKRERVNAHHMFSRAAYPSFQYDVNNGLTMCFKHHHEFHKIYGYRITSPNQVLDYMNGRYYKSMGDLLMLSGTN